ncbi:hypothetical protein LMZ02_10680 [Paenibacillus macerans]|uniref:hypothetical protein n=1 Tax=Paenibacillus macerans TaxID=44252 RepID=UPI001F10DE62|nr:hypothetical protein [Paenibacillus macerans]UMV49779.1 hypothetical protein LMZ02_10680 [Paenibacillus macerans]
MDALVAEIAEMDYADAETWKMLLDPAYESAKAYEEEMIRQIRAMNEQGTQLDWMRPKETVRKTFRCCRTTYAARFAWIRKIV